MFSMYLIAGVVGVMLFFSVAVAPTIFKVLPQEFASIYVRKFFPKYYLTLGLTSAIASLFTENTSVSLVTLVCVILFAVSLWLLTPAVNKAKDANNIKQFNLLHGLSVVVNVVILLLLIYCFWL